MNFWRPDDKFAFLSARGVKLFCASILIDAREREKRVRLTHIHIHINIFAASRFTFDEWITSKFSFTIISCCVHFPRRLEKFSRDRLIASAVRNWAMFSVVCREIGLFLIEKFTSARFRLLTLRLPANAFQQKTFLWIFSWTLSKAI